MDGFKLQNLMSKGLGVGARRLGTPFVVLRPRTALSPLSTQNRVIKLHAAFSSHNQSFRNVSAYGDPLWLGVYDYVYTQPGDYLCGEDGTGSALIFFVAAQQPLLPVQCVRTNRTVQVSRPPPPALGGYGGMVAESAVLIIAGWPASLLTQNARISGTLPETRYGNWLLLLPLLPATLLVGDVVTDDIGRTFLVAAAEQSDLGWRLTVKQVAG